MTGKIQTRQWLGEAMTSRANVNGVARLQEQIKAIQQREAIVDQKLLETSRLIDQQSMAAVEEFPLDPNGVITSEEPEQVQEWTEQLKDFFSVDDRCGGRCQQTWPRYIEKAYPWMLGWSLEAMLVALLIRTHHHRRNGRCWLQYLEVFAGKGNLSRAAIEAGLQGASLDIEMNQDHDILQAYGLKLLLSCLTATLAGALLWVATPCSTFVILSSSVCKRTFENQYLGDIQRYCVQEGNVLADLSGLVLLLGFLLSLKDGMEQPSSSVMPCTPAIRAVLEYIGGRKTETFHFNFGAPTLKPLQLWSSCPYMTRMKRDRPSVACIEASALAEKDQTSGGFTGRKELLKESQEYTLEFGRSVISALLEARRP